MTYYRLPGKFSQRVFTPDETIEREGATLHRFDLSTTDSPAYKWFNEKQLTLMESTTMNKYAKNDKITIGDMVAIYDSYTKKDGEITTHYLTVADDKQARLTVTPSQMRDIPQAEPFSVGQLIEHENTRKPITEVRFPFYKFVWQSSPSNTSTQWLHHERVAPLLIAEAKLQPIAETPAPDIDKALYEEMLTKIERLKVELDEHVTALTKANLEKEKLERDLKKAKNTPTPIGEVDVIRRERDELREVVKTLAETKRERDQLRTQVAMLAQEKPKSSETDVIAIVTGETAQGMAKRRKQGFSPIHMQFESGKLNVVYQREENTDRLPVMTHATTIIPARQPDYASALNNRSVGADELSAIGNEAIMKAGADIYYGKKAE